MSEYINETNGLRCAGRCGALIPVGASFKVITTPSLPYKNTCMDCAPNALLEKHAREDSPAEEALRVVESRQRVQKRKDREGKVRAGIAADQAAKRASNLTQGSERANINRP